MLDFAINVLAREGFASKNATIPIINVCKDACELRMQVTMLAYASYHVKDCSTHLT